MLDNFSFHKIFLALLACLVAYPSQAGDVVVLYKDQGMPNLTMPTVPIQTKTDCDDRGQRCDFEIYTKSRVDALVGEQIRAVRTEVHDQLAGGLSRLNHDVLSATVVEQNNQQLEAKILTLQGQVAALERRLAT